MRVGMKQRNEALARLEPFIGMWDSAPVVDGVQVMRGTMEFAWAEDGGFVVQRAASEVLDTAPPAWHDNAPPQTVSMVGLDGDAYLVLYADSRDVHRMYHMDFDGRTWTMWRDSPGFDQRFHGELSDDGQTVNARWERSEDGKKTWLLDFELTLTKLR